MMEALDPFLLAAVRISIPLVLAVIGEIVVERAGVLNIGLEGLMLAGAFGGFAGAALTGSAASGIVAGALAALLFAALFSMLVVRGHQDAIIVGIAVNILALGITGVLSRAMTSGGTEHVRVATLPVMPVPYLSKLPVAGPLLFEHNVLGYAAILLAAFVAWFLSRTTPGLIVRACGENPESVDTAGIDVRKVRSGAILFGGLLAGLAGVYLAIGYSDTFVENMTAGRGFVALAIVVFARWHPIGGWAGALMFGAAMALQARMQGERMLGIEIPYHFFQMLPYALTLLVLAITSSAGSRPPASLGKPYVRGHS
jgi:ABC-type uncharacterized transport system permease subunit